VVKKGEITSSSLFSIQKISSCIENGEILPTDLVDICLRRIKKLNPILNSFITIIDEQQIYNQAELAEKKIKKGEYHGPLHGIPFSIKDNFYAKNIKFTAGSKIFANYTSQVEANALKKMLDAGAILIGTNNMDEFASGITGKNAFYGDSKNPWDIERISGGSSGGSAVSVSTGMVLASLGTDTGGSIRVPSALCGVVGLKPTYNLISKKKVFPLAPSLDHVGCLTKNVMDASIILRHICNDKFKGIEKERTVKSIDFLHKKNRKKIILGIPIEYFFDFLETEVKDIFFNLVEYLSSFNAKFEYIKLHNAKKYYESWKVIRLAEASEIHQTWLKSKELDYSNEVKKMLIDGSIISAIDYIKAKNITKQIRKEFVYALHNIVDAIITPTTTTAAPKSVEDHIYLNNGMSMKIREALLRNTIVFNSIGLPAISIPIGLTANNRLPVGIQIIGPPYGENLILSIAYQIERIIDKTSKFIPPLARAM
jgi:aspartyl-tRNA(Asn)/glutamyl-tRNA(Gln) amidotransferase subunit A